jgi:hypothetical protein
MMPAHAAALRALRGAFFMPVEAPGRSVTVFARIEVHFAQSAFYVDFALEPTLISLQTAS